MQILCLVTDAFGGSGGIAQYNRDLISALASMPSVHKIVVLPVATTTETSDLPAKVYQHAVPKSKLSYIWYLLSSIKNNGPFELVFCGHLHLLIPATLTASVLRIPLWIQIHGIEAWKRPRRFISWAIQKASFVTSVSRFTRRRFLSWAPISQQKVKILPNMSSSRFSIGCKSETILRRFSLIDKKVLLTVGRLSTHERYKGHDRVISLMPRLLARNKSLVYLIVGDGDDRPRLEAMAKEAGVQEAVIFAGKVPWDELPDVYRSGDVYVMPSTGEGFGIVFLEAAASGIPVIGSNKDGTVDALIDGRGGTLVDPDNPDELLAGIERALKTSTTDPEWTKAFSMGNFRQHVEGLLASL